MAALTTVYWRDIPTQVIVKSDRGSAKRPLADRFLKAVDMAAMRSRAHETDDYLAAWRRSPPQDCGDDCEAEAGAAVARLEAEYDDARIKRLVAGGGHETDG